MKIITSTLLIATLFTSNIIASQGCANGTCMASFGKNSDSKVVATTTVFHPNVLKNNMLTTPKLLVAYTEYIKNNEIAYSENSLEENINNEEYIDNNIIAYSENSLEENINNEEYTDNNIIAYSDSENSLEENINNEEYTDNDTIAYSDSENSLEENINEIDSENNMESEIDENSKFANLLKNKALDAEADCEESQKILTCDISGDTDTSECTCA